MLQLAASLRVGHQGSAVDGVLSKAGCLLSSLHRCLVSDSASPVASSWPSSFSSSSAAPASSAAVSGRGAGFATSVSPDQQQASSSGQVAPSQIFSIRPSFLSPLYVTYQRDKEIEDRRQLLLKQLSAHASLANQVEGLDDEQIKRSARYRISQIRSISKDIRSLMERPGAVPLVSKCEKPDHAFGYYAILERRAAQADKEATEFAGLAHGGSVWDYWETHFAEKYRTVPSLPDLASLFSQQGADLSYAKLAAGVDGQSKQKSGGSSQSSHGAYLDAAGVAHSEGKRKESFVRAQLRRGSGQIIINGSSYENYFSDVNYRAFVLQPYFVTGSLGQFDADVKVSGGGPSGQAQAIRTALSRALGLHLPAYAAALRPWARWDGRQVERKKPARKKARRGFQWVKR